MSSEIQKILDSLKNKFPEKWNYEMKSGQLMFYSSDDVFILKENKINAPSDLYDKSEKNKDRIIKYGNKTKAIIKFKVIDYKNLDDLVGFGQKTCYFFDGKILILEEQNGIEDEFNSVYPFNIPSQIFKIKEILSEKLINILCIKPVDFSGYVDKSVILIGKISEIYWQHMILSDPVYRYPEYFDVDDIQIIVYFKSNYERHKNIIGLIGKLVEVKGTSKKSGDGDYMEYGLLVDKILF